MVLSLEKGWADWADRSQGKNKMTILYSGGGITRVADADADQGMRLERIEQRNELVQVWEEASGGRRNNSNRRTEQQQSHFSSG